MAVKRELTASEIMQTLAQTRTRLERMAVRRIGLFGSYRRAEAHHDSDIDLLVTFEKPSFDVYRDVKIYLEDLFGREIDLVIEETTKPRLRAYILSEVEYA